MKNEHQIDFGAIIGIIQKMIVIESAAQLARNRLLLYLNKTGTRNESLKKAFDELEKALNC